MNLPHASMYEEVKALLAPKLTEAQEAKNQKAMELCMAKCRKLLSAKDKEDQNTAKTDPQDHHAAISLKPSNSGENKNGVVIK